MPQTLQELNCDWYRFKVLFDETQFDVRGFRKVSSLPKNEQIDVSVTSNSERPGRHEHSHIEVGIDGEDSSITATFHPEEAEFEEPDVSGRNTTEKRIKELAGFLKKKKAAVVVGVQFRFSAKHYEPCIILGHPLGLPDTVLKGAFVSGQEIAFKEGPVRRILLTANEKFITIFIASVRDISLSTFVIERWVEKELKFAQSLIRGTEHAPAANKTT